MYRKDQKVGTVFSNNQVYESRSYHEVGIYYVLLQIYNDYSSSIQMHANRR
jgi:hypothetical protein